VAFGDAVRVEAERRGIAPTRVALQDLGDELIAAGWDSFCERVLGQAQWTEKGLLVVDGVRHLGAIDALKRAVPDRVIVVFVDASHDERVRRLADRGIDADEAAGADMHPNEAEVDQVRQRADILIENCGSIVSAIDIAAASLEALGVQHTGP
jgi:dephospho-CoA kinase